MQLLCSRCIVSAATFFGSSTPSAPYNRVQRNATAPKRRQITDSRHRENIRFKLTSTIVPRQGLHSSMCFNSKEIGRLGSHFYSIECAPGGQSLPEPRRWGESSQTRGRSSDVLSAPRTGVSHSSRKLKS